MSSVVAIVMVLFPPFLGLGVVGGKQEYIFIKS